MDKTRTTNMLLLVIVIPIIFYLLKVLSFIFIPLVFSMFIALLFLPLMRFLGKKKVPKKVSIVIVVLIILGGLKIGGELVKISSRQILATESTFFVKAQTKINDLVYNMDTFFGVEPAPDRNLKLTRFFKKDEVFSKFGPTFNIVSKFLTSLLMTTFFVVLWLGESINVEKLLNKTLLKKKHTSIKTFRKIEKDLIKFIKVKFLVSFLTGVGTGLACYFFDVSFPVFWGLFAFLINFVQMVGSFISVILLSIFAFVELDPTSTLLFFVLSITGVQVLFGAILEPIFMGKSFSINIITVLVMLMFWGFIWGIPGLIMAIPITVFLKIIFEQFPSTKGIASLISGSGQ
ncbi:AI-2E family transporter [Pontimicrobium sp. MEBiC06410]